MKRILITGENSYVGNSFEKWLKDHGDELPEEIKADKISLRSDKWEQADFSVYDSVLHVAGIAHVDTDKVSESGRKEYFRVNRDLTLKVASKAQKEGVSQFIFLSSIIVYGDSAPVHKKKVITPEAEPKPSNFYGESKLEAEKCLEKLQRDAAEAYASNPSSHPPMNVAIIRSPMIYGKGSKGNYRTLEKVSRILPIFPAIINERSMISVSRLCRFIYMLIKNGDAGMFYPQDPNYVCTSSMVRKIAEKNGRKIILTEIFNPFVYMLSGKGKAGRIIDKAFGNLVYDKSMSSYRDDYQTSMHNIPSVSVVTVAFNSASEIGRTIESVLAQGKKPNEYIVIDGASSDGTTDKAEEYRSRLEAAGVSFRVISEPDKGIYDAMNKGIRLATCDITGFLNSGDVYEPCCIEETVKKFTKTACDVTYGNIRIVKTDGRSFVKKARLRRYKSSRDWNHPTMFVRSSLLRDYPFICKGIHDDYALFLTLVKNGADIKVIDKTLASFSMGGASNRKSLKAAVKRISDRYKYCYRANGYSPLYIAECVGIELAKWVIG